MKNTENKRKFTDAWFKFLQSQICSHFQNLENNYAKEKNIKSKTFLEKKWFKKKIKEGGGTSLILKDGLIFDKVGVNQSTVKGQFNKEFRSKILGAEKDGKYWASGISVVAHMKNPKIPAIHFNTRFISTTKHWFGGGMDATPCIRDEKEKNFIHKKLEFLCKKNKKNYKNYKKYCDNYFFLPHRNELRGIGGIFFDYESGDWVKNFQFIRDFGFEFINISKNIITKKINTRWNLKEKEDRLYKRGRYVEFNLLYDRGTKFGLNTGGNIDAILMSMPPQAKWK